MFLRSLKITKPLRIGYALICKFFFTNYAITYRYLGKFDALIVPKGIQQGGNVANLFDSSRLLTPEEAAHLLNLNPQTLNVWRATQRYPLPFVKVGRRVRYRYSDLMKFIEENTSSLG